MGSQKQINKNNLNCFSKSKFSATMFSPWINRNLLIQICVILYYVCDISCQEDVMVKMKTIKDKIFQNYDRTIRPMNDTNYTKVDIDFIPAQIMSLDEETSILSLDAYLFVIWWDHRLSWDSMVYAGKLALPADLIWLPDLTIFNSHARQPSMSKDLLIEIWPSGVLIWTTPLHTQTYCPAVAKATYPSERIDCLIEIGSWGYDGFTVDITHPNSLWLHYFQDINPRWSLIQSETKGVVNDTHKEQYGFIKIDILLPLQRLPLPEIESTRASCTLILVLTLSIFWIPVESSKKVLLGGILFFVLNILLVFVGLKTKQPLAIMYAVSFVQSAMYILVTTILLQVLVITRMASCRGPSRPPSVLINVLQGAVGRWACIGNPFQEDRLSLDRVQLKDDFQTTGGGLTANDEWKMLATALDRISFLVMAIASISVHHL